MLTIVIISVLVVYGIATVAKTIAEKAKREKQEIEIQMRGNTLAQSKAAYYRVVQIGNNKNQLYLTLSQGGKYAISRESYDAHRFETREEATEIGKKFDTPECQIVVEKIGDCMECGKAMVLKPAPKWRAKRSHWKEVDWSLCDTCVKSSYNEALVERTDIFIRWGLILAMFLFLILANLWKSII